MYCLSRTGRDDALSCSLHRAAARKLRFVGVWVTAASGGVYQSRKASAPFTGSLTRGNATGIPPLMPRITVRRPPRRRAPWPSPGVPFPIWKPGRAQRMTNRDATQNAAACNLVKLRGGTPKNYEVVTPGPVSSSRRQKQQGRRWTPALGPRDKTFLWLGCFAFAFPMGERCTAHGATQKTASDEKPQHAALSASAFVVLAFALVFVFILAAFAEEMGPPF